MYKVPVIPAKGKATSRELPLPEEVNPHLLYEVVRWQLASRRRGTASTKTRGEVKFSTRKLFPQKGLGRARHGSRGANIFVGGGVAFGPRPRDYGYTLPKKVRRAGLAMALADRAREEKLLVVEAFAGVEGKTKQFVEWAGKHGLDGSERVTLVTADANVRRAAHVRVGGDQGDALRAVQPVLTGPLDELLGLALDAGEGLDDEQLLLAGAVGQRHGQAGAAHLLGQGVAVVAGARPEGDAAAHEDVGPAAAVTGAAQPLLGEELAGRELHLAAGLRRRGAAPPARQLPAHHLVEEVGVHLFGQGQLARGGLPLGGNDGNLVHHFAPLSRVVWRTTTRPPLGPGIAPLMRSRFSSGITSTTSRFCTVMRSAP